ncbi:MAG: KPN_02809 family neutral zinc metallopeptidase [Calditrichia bacterium]
MRWKGRQKSSNVEDRRGSSAGRGMKIGGGIGTIAIIFLVYLLGGDPSSIIQQQASSSQTSGSGSYQPNAQEQELAQFVSVVLKDTEDVWANLFRRSGQSYRKPTMVLYSGSVQSACGYGQAAAGPFYCPGDYKLYIDLSFYDELNRKFKAPGDFAMAYVIAHEVGHHVQNLLGVSDQVMSMRNRVSKTEFNKYMVKLELQADFYAGVWAHHAQKMKNILEQGDLEEAIRAASAVGDDMIQKRTQGYVVPEAFTHGSAEQRMRWFRKGLESGDVTQGDTFNARRL